MVVTGEGADMRTSVFRFMGNGGGRSVVDDFVEELGAARDDGFETVWVPQLPWEPDLLTLLAVAMREVDSIAVGTGVIPIQSRLPMVLAQQALTVNLIAGGRLKLGIGMTHPMISEGMWGVPWDRNVRRLNEYLDGLLPLLAGERVDAPGELTTTRGFLDIPSVPAPPVYVAALGPQLLKVAARRTAGTVTWMTGPNTIRDHVIATMRAAGGDAHPEVIAAFPICVTDDAAAARAFAAEALGMYGAQPSYRAMLDREGLEGPGDIAILGDEASVTAQIEGLAEIGVDELGAYVLAPNPEDAARTRALLRARLGLTVD